MEKIQRTISQICCIGMLLIGMAGWASAQEEGKQYALLIGIDDYTYISDLSFCVADIKGLQQQLLQCGFADERVYLMHDQAVDRKRQPSKDTIERTLKVILSLAGEKDTILVAFAGHGLHLGNESYFCPLNADPSNRNSLLSVQWVYDELLECDAAQKLLIVDACRNRVEMPGHRSVIGNNPRQLMSTFQKPPKGIITLTSCDVNESAIEDEDLAHGVFTHFLLKGLGGQADINQDGEVGILELFLFVNRKTKDYVGKNFLSLQQPTLHGTINGDFIVSSASSSASPIMPVDTSASLVKRELAEVQARHEKKSHSTALSEQLGTYGEGRFDIWKSLAESGNPEAQTLLGACFKVGRFIEKDLTEARNWFRKAAEQRVAFAQYLLGTYYHSEEEQEDYQEARRWYQAAAQQNLALAQNCLGLLYRKGDGVSQDYEEAVRWYRLAVQQELPAAQYNLGIVYEQGYGVEQDYAEALKWFRLSADQEDEWAQISIGHLYRQGHGVEQDYQEAFKWYRLASEQNFTDGQVSLAYLYLKGLGVEQDFDQALHYYHLAAEQEDKTAQYSLGNMYESGEGVEEDLNEAERWYRLSAEQGYATAQVALGNLYIFGSGEVIEANEEEAVKWYRMAAEQGDATGQKNLGYMYEMGFGIEESYEEAARWYRLAAEQGNDRAQYYLGELYKSGNGVEKDLEEARKWYRLAAEQGHETAEDTLKRLEEK
ncbi:Hypothetical protein PBC10988_9890 [Planctomycetales bacterium 10988]|nr:Hypothetical protein PBC10988_9890 [Planctomycetales bacterium 10988]